MDDTYFRKVMSTGILIVLVVLAYLLLQPLLIALIVALILAFVFSPVYNLFYKVLKSKNLAASLICVILALLVILPIWFLTPILIDQSFKFFLAVQQVDFVTPLKQIFPSLFASEQFSHEIGNILQSFVSRSSNYLVNEFTQIILQFPTLALQFTVAFFTFFFVLRDKDLLIGYIKSLLPFSKEVEKKIFDYSEGITMSVIYGQVLVGILQGVIVGVGLFLFGVPNPLFLTILAIFAGILPILGPMIIWVPVVVYLFIAGNSLHAIGMLLFGTFASTIDNFLRPLIVSRRIKIHPALVLVGMIGGIFLFGILGFILGPLILSYLIIVLELYRNKKAPEVLIKHEN